MKNYEKYAEEIREYDGSNFCKDFIEPYILKSFNAKCTNISCIKCATYWVQWLLEDYEEPETDWSEVEVDTPILVRVNENVGWLKRYFAKYENGAVYAWDSGRTSWNETIAIAWKYAKLAESEEGGAK